MSGKWIVDAVVDALRRGKAMEREAIVAWLRADGGDVCNAYADEIERGEHLEGN